MEDQYLTVATVAKRLNISKMTVYRLIHDGELTGAIKINKTYRVPESALEDYLEKIKL